MPPDRLTPGIIGVAVGWNLDGRTNKKTLGGACMGRRLPGHLAVVAATTVEDTHPPRDNASDWLRCAKRGVMARQRSEKDEEEAGR